jgi:hypothetical protein
VADTEGAGVIAWLRKRPPQAEEIERGEDRKTNNQPENMNAKPTIKKTSQVLSCFEVKDSHTTTTITIWSGSWQGFNPHASVYNTGGGGEFQETVESSRSRFKQLIKKGATWQKVA